MAGGNLPARHRLDAGFVAAFVATVPGRQETVDIVHGLSDFFSNSASSPFAVTSPTRLHEKGAHPVLVSRSLLQFFMRLVTLRMDTLLGDAVRSLNESRLLAFAMAARGVLETAAVVAYHAGDLSVPPDAAGLPEGYDARLRRAVMSGRFDWLKYFEDHAARQALIDGYDSDPDAQVPETNATNINTMVKHLGNRLRATTPRARGIVLLDYAMLSDICHPSVGGHIAFVLSSEPEIRAELGGNPVLLRVLAAIVLQAIGYAAGAAAEVLAELELADERLGKLGTGPGTT